MGTIEQPLLIALGSILAGFIGVLTGLGGGVVIVPLLTLVFGVDIRYAIGASLVSVIATSSSAAATYVKEGYSNLRVGMFLEIATTMGALSGAFLALWIAPRVIAVIFGLALLHSAYTSWQGIKESTETKADRLAQMLGMDSTYPTPVGPKFYHVQNIPGGFLLMMVAGALSGLLGIGSGALKVIAMDRIMKLPFKVSTTTSNFMIGVTAAASAGIYLNRGYIDPLLAMPVMLGVLLGASIGTHWLMKSRTKSLRILFGIVILILAVEMIFNGIEGRF
ncbi:MAG: sulfite exporter TauE/SafE family protein [Candidatus Omnitrophica bacterium]|nr:sulfite exporter TauE/SafE family protein [Candidatus Omnitrophota bacterium]MDE2008684.1 sulfite exporter TauE/SafE family protein [Candidatus Omnitrophota bacterium]MDE2214825.1 sulfite exporter TauE/SafE family protein [Candidatus Omnitrophota bacterium]MDE2231945.1 sulfite exporter TauE/SafE family protein [Candidatus Omnitrophota bacterium]